MSTVSSVEELLTLYPAVNPNSLRKERPALTDEYRALIEASPFVALATVGDDGMDCSPRGDRGQAVTVVDDRTLHLPDRRGNNRLDSLRNIVVDGRVGLLFLLPGLGECLRVNGRACLRVDAELLQRYAVDGKQPVTVIEVSIESVYFQCARAVKRSGLWDPDLHLDPATLPRPGAIVAAIDASFDGAAYDANLEDRQANTLY